MVSRKVLFLVLLCTVWLAVDAQTQDDLKKLLDAAQNWTRTEVEAVDAGMERVFTIAHPPKFTVIDEGTGMMPIVLFNSKKQLYDTNSSEPIQRNVSVEVYTKMLNTLDKALGRLLTVAERSYVISTDNVVVTVSNFTVQLLFNTTTVNQTLQKLLNDAIQSCIYNSITKPNCKVPVLSKAEYPIAALQVYMYANRIGRSDIVFMVRADNGTVVGLANDTQAAKVEVIVVRPDQLIDYIFRWCMTVFILFITFGMGCELDLKVIFVILRRPIAPIIGFCSQFVLMPLISFGIGQLFLNTPETKLFGFGLLVIGCSPGGGSSNMWTLMLGGHLDLSMTMTFFSSTFALFMMPLWLFLLAPFYVDPSQVVIPYFDVVKNLLMFTLPAAIGIGLRSWKSKWADKAKTPVKYATFFYLIFMITFGTWVNWYMYRTISYFPYLIPIAMILPWCGMAFGYLLAFILRQGHRKALTIAIETGIQNVGVAMIILRYAFPPPDGQLAAVVVMIVILFTPIPLYLALIIQGLYRFWLRRREEKIISDSSSEAEEGVQLKDYELDTTNAHGTEEKKRNA